MSESKQYPKFLYHKQHGGIIVDSEDQEKALGGAGWEDSPAKHGIETHPQKKLMQKFFTIEGKEFEKEGVVSLPESPKKPAKDQTK